MSVRTYVLRKSNGGHAGVGSPIRAERSTLMIEKLVVVGFLVVIGTIVLTTIAVAVSYAF